MRVVAWTRLDGQWKRWQSGPLQHRDDLARAAAVVLASEDTSNQILTLTGEQAWSARDVATRVSALTGKPLAVVDVTPTVLPVLVNGSMVSRSVGMPALRAETLSPPMAKIQFPKGDR